MVEVVYRYEENFGVKGPKSNKKDVGLPMTMPQAAGKKLKLLSLKTEQVVLPTTPATIKGINK